MKERDFTGGEKMKTKKQYAWNVWHMVAMFFMTIALVCCVKLPTVQSLAEEVTVTPTPTVVASPTIEPTQPSTTTIDGKTYYEIDTAAKLYWFAGLVNGTLEGVSQNTSANAVLTENIDLNKSMANVDLMSINTTDGKLSVDENTSALWVEWIPIGKYTNDASKNVNYSGTFDGQGHTISHLFINEDQQGKTTDQEGGGSVYYPSDDERYLGFIGIGEGSTVKNLGIIDSYIRGYRHMGSIIANGGTIENCFSNSTIVSHFYTGHDLEDGSTDYYVGGIAPNSTVKNSYFTGTLYFDGKRDSNSIGGEKYAIGNKFKITNCFSTNNLVSFDGEYVGSSDYDAITKITKEQITNGQLAHMLQESILNGQEYWSQGTARYPVPAKGDLVQHDYEENPSLSNCCCGKYKLEENLNEIWQSISIMKKEDIPVEKTKEDDKKYYQLDSVEDLYWFAGLVNGSKYVCRTYTDDSGNEFELTQNVYANAILIDNITINKQVVQKDGKTLVEDASNLIPWIPIGQEDITAPVDGTNYYEVLKHRAYKGIFDGNGHTISGVYCSYENVENIAVGFFGDIIDQTRALADNIIKLDDACGTIQNVAIKDSYFVGEKVGGICAKNYGKIENCYSNAVVSSNGGGLVGNNFGEITSCYYAGTSDGAIAKNSDTGIIGKITNCISDTKLDLSVELNKVQASNSICVIDGEYVLYGFGGTLKLPYGNLKENGVFAYILNNKETEKTTIRWYQNIGTDSEPVLDSTHSIVYAGQLAEDAPLHCWNTSESEEQGHVYGTEGSSQYYCKYCCEVNKEAKIKIDENNTTTLIKDGTWQINSKDALIAFATYINHYYTPTYQDAVLLCDIDLNDDTSMKNVNFSEVSVGSDSTVTETYRKLIDNTGEAIDTTKWLKWIPIGTNNKPYKGTFDGQGHEIQHVYINGSFEESTTVEQAYMGLFSVCTSGAIIKNLGVKDSYITGYRCASISATAGTIQNCYSNAILVGGATYKAACAGIGLSASDFNNVDTWKDYNVNVSNSYFTGNMYGNDITYLYPISYPSDVAKNCYFSEKTALTKDDFIEITFTNSTWIDSAELSNDHLAHRLQYATSESVWSQDSTKNYPVPKLGDKIDHMFTDGICCCGMREDLQDIPKPNDEGKYEIYTADQLYWFAGLVNGDENVCIGNVEKNPSANAVLMMNITINQEVLDSDGKLTADSSDLSSWIPIGKDGYEGTFDGNGHTISGLYCDSTERNIGLFGIVCNGAKIENVTVEDSYFNGLSYVGGICGQLYVGTMEGCSSEATVTGSEDNVGGLCGYSYQGTIQDCSSKATVTGSGDNVGGICGQFSSGTIQDCSSKATVTGSGYVGGICGKVLSSTIKGCSSEGTVTGNGSVGGICGLLDYESPIEHCFSRGTVTGSGNNVGGICGEYSRHYSSSNYWETMKGCFSEATVTGSGNNVGGICGYNGNNKITQCYYKGTVSSSTKQYVGGIVGQNNGVGGVTYSISNCNFGIIGYYPYYSSNNISIQDNIATKETFTEGELPQEFILFFDENVNNAQVLETSGALTYFLNQCQTQSDIYGYQKLTGENVDSQPVLCTIESNNPSFVYAGQLCPGKYGFSNDTNEFSEEHSYQYASGLNACEHCGLAGAKVGGYNVELGGKIGLNFHMILNDTSLETNSYMKFTWGSDEEKNTITLTDISSLEKTIDGITYYILPCEVAAKEMADTITAEFCATINGKEVVLVTDAKSVKDYAKVIIQNAESNEDYTKAQPLVKAMLNYGAYAQQHFDYNVGNLANSDFSDKGIATKNTVKEALTLYNITLPENSTFIKYIGSSLILLSDTTMRIYFELLDGTTIENVTFTGVSNPTEYRANGKTYYYVDVVGIKPNSLNENIDITAQLSSGTDSYTVTINPMYYVKEMLNKNTTETEESLTDLSKLLCALYSYHSETVEYLKATESSNN